MTATTFAKPNAQQREETQTDLLFRLLPRLLLGLLKLLVLAAQQATHFSFLPQRAWRPCALSKANLSNVRLYPIEMLAKGARHIRSMRESRRYTQANRVLAQPRPLAKVCYSLNPLLSCSVDETASWDCWTATTRLVESDQVNRPLAQLLAILIKQILAPLRGQSAAIDRHTSFTPVQFGILNS